jgi:hypothetical protein
MVVNQTFANCLFVWNQRGVQPVHQLDLDHLKKGMYALRILTNNGPSILKFIID